MSTDTISEAGPLLSTDPVTTRWVVSESKPLVTPFDGQVTSVSPHLLWVKWDSSI